MGIKEDFKGVWQVVLASSDKTVGTRSLSTDRRSNGKKRKNRQTTETGDIHRSVQANGK